MKKVTSILLSMMILFSQAFSLPVFAESGPSVTVPVSVVIEGPKPSPSEDYTIQLIGLDDAPMPEESVDGVYSMTITGEDTKNLPMLTYDEVGIYEYNIVQVAGTTKNVKYDDTKYVLTVSVTNTEDMTGYNVTAALKPSDSDLKDSGATFTNVYPTPSKTTNKTNTGIKTNNNANLYLALFGGCLIVLVALFVRRKHQN